MDMASYLERIAYSGAHEPTLKTLKELHSLHLHAVPFENLDFHLRRPIAPLTLPRLFDKVVRRRRGGICFELNGLFGWLLEQLGFEVTLLSARSIDDGKPASERNHVLLLVQAQGQWIADVGFAQPFLQPLLLKEDLEQQQAERSYRLVRQSGQIILQERQTDAWDSHYAFSLEPCLLAEFHPILDHDYKAMCNPTQTFPPARFRHRAICSMPTRDGRVSLKNNRLVLITAGQREEREIASVDEYKSALKQYFGINLDDETRIDRLLTPGTHS